MDMLLKMKIRKMDTTIIKKKQKIEGYDREIDELSRDIKNHERQYDEGRTEKKTKKLTKEIHKLSDKKYILEKEIKELMEERDKMATRLMLKNGKVTPVEVDAQGKPIPDIEKEVGPVPPPEQTIQQEVEEMEVAPEDLGKEVPMKPLPVEQSLSPEQDTSEEAAEELLTPPEQNGENMLPPQDQPVPQSPGMMEPPTPEELQQAADSDLPPTATVHIALTTQVLKVQIKTEELDNFMDKLIKVMETKTILQIGSNVINGYYITGANVE